MSALRKAGVWLGLIEDEDDDDAYDDREIGSGRPRGSLREDGWAQRRDRARVRQRDPGSRGRRYDDYPDDDPDNDVALAVTGGDDADRAEELRHRPTERLPPRRPDRAATDDRATVRSITRDSTVSYLTRDNLALAPQPVPRERPAPSPDESHRYQITTLHPTTYREARTIGEHFREGTPVIMNLTEMEEADARRLVDFGAGLAFGLRGSMERVTNRVFLLSPANVHVTAEDKARIAEGGFFHHR